MAESRNHSPASGAAENPADRLDSWKEIAAYLRRNVSTVQRWEKREGLPVHRHVHYKLGSVYALRGELDRWEQARSGLLEGARDGEVEASPHPEIPRRRGFPLARWRSPPSCSGGAADSVTDTVPPQPAAAQRALAFRAGCAGLRGAELARSDPPTLMEPASGHWAGAAQCTGPFRRPEREPRERAIGNLAAPPEVPGSWPPVDRGAQCTLVSPSTTVGESAFRRRPGWAVLVLPRTHSSGGLVFLRQ